MKDQNLKKFGLFSLTALLFGGLLFLAGCENGDDDSGDQTTKEACTGDNKYWVVDADGATNDDNKPLGECKECEDGQQPNPDKTACVAASPDDDVEVAEVTQESCHAQGQKFENGACVACSQGYSLSANQCVPGFSVTCKCRYLKASGYTSRIEIEDIVGSGVDSGAAQADAVAKCVAKGGGTTDGEVVAESCN